MTRIYVDNDGAVLSALDSGTLAECEDVLDCREHQEGLSHGGDGMTESA